jgi:uncharacterized protein YdaU (DUF1376 family)
MSNGDRWMPLYVADYLGDTMHLTTLQHGAYVLLLMHYWRTGPLPDDQEALASIVKLDPMAWTGVWAKLSAFFTVNGDGTLHQKRMDCERQRWTELSEKRSDAGKLGGAGRHRSRPTASKPQANAKQTLSKPDSKTEAKAKQLLPICLDFACVPVPSKEEDVLFLSSQKGAREAKQGKTEQNLPREPDHLELILRESLEQAEAGHKESLMSHERRRTLDEQRAAVAKPPRAKACYITGPALAALRKQAGIWTAPS